MLPARGAAGGVLIGFNDKKFDVLAWMNGEFRVFLLWLKSAWIILCGD